MEIGRHNPKFGGFNLKDGQGVGSKTLKPESGQDSRSFKVKLFGREYIVRGRGSGDYIERLVEFINSRSEEIKGKSGVVNTIDLAILTLLNITDELFECRQSISGQIERMEEEDYGLLKPGDLGETDLKIPLRDS